MFNVRVEYEPTPIRHIAVQCPKCKKWFYGKDITKDNLRNEFDINYANFICPICNEEFGGIQHADKPIIEETAYPKVYEGCVQKKEIWE